MWKRNTDDPLMRLFLDKYYLHLLSVPRENVAVGDLYVHDGKQVFAPGKVTYFLEPPLEMPPVTTGEKMADVSEIVSHGVSIQVGLKFFENFLTAFGAGEIVNKVRAIYEAKKVNVMMFRFAHATRDSMDMLLMGSKLIRHRLIEDHPLYEKGHRYYLVTAVVRTPSISIISESNKTKVGIGDIGTMKIAEVAPRVTVEESHEAEITFSGEKNLAFGVVLHELLYDSKRNKLKFKLPKGLIKVMKPSSERLVNPAFIGGPDDDVFLTVESGAGV